MSKTPIHSEADALLGLAHLLLRARSDMGTVTREVEALLGDAVRCEEQIQVELGLEAAARRLRAGWLRSVAAETSRLPRSPTEHEIEGLAKSRHDAYGYERDFQPESLEARCETFFGAAPPGWTAAHVTFSSGQAALATLLLHLAEGQADKLRVAHIGSYFETAELVKRACVPADTPDDADCVIVEPIACDGRFSTHDTGSIARALAAGQTLVVDETLSAPRTQAPAILTEDLTTGVAVVRLVSGLKLLQQGLELANIGILSIFAKEAERALALAEGLKRCRTLTGTGLRFVDALALEAPFFLDREATQAYADRVFAHNTALAREVTARNRVFRPLGDVDSAVPYCAFEFETGNSTEALEALAARLEREAQARGLLIERGGSFGFRGHRYELIEPESGEPPFLRVALGARDDHSCHGLVELLGSLASGL